MPKHLDAWVNSSGVRVEVEHSLAPRLAIGTTTVPAGTLDAIDAEELAAGWPAAMVAKNRARRAQKRDVFMSANGISVGRPAAALLGDNRALAWLSGMRASHWVNRNLGNAAPHLRRSTPLDPNAIRRVRNQQAMGGCPNAPMTNAGNVALVGVAFFEHFAGWTPTVVESGVASLSGHYPSGAEARPLLAKADADHFVLIFPMMIGGTMTTMATPQTGWIKIARPSWFPLSGAMVWWSYAQSSLQNHDPTAGAWPTVSFVMGEPGFRLLIGNLSEYGYHATTPFNGAAYDLVGTNDTAWVQPSDSTSRSCGWAEKATRSRTTLALPSGDQAGAPHLGLVRLSAHAFGDPEFTLASHFLGNVEWNVFKRKLTVRGASIGLEFAGETLSAVLRSNASAPQAVTAAQINTLDKKVIRTFIHHTKLDPERDAVERLPSAEDIGFDVLRKETFIPASTIDGTPAITFGEAERRAGELPFEVVHTMLDTDGATYPDMFVRGYVGTVDASGLTEIRLEFVDGASTGATVASIWALLASGTLVDFGSTGMTDAFYELVEDVGAGVLVPETLVLPVGRSASTVEWVQAGQALAGTRTEDGTTSDAHAPALVGTAKGLAAVFDESITFRNALPDVRGLTAEQRAGFALMNACYSRRHLSTMAITAMVMANTVGKRLVTVG